MKKIMMLLIMVAAFALPTMAQNFQSTSTMQSAGNGYEPQLTAVGAATVTEMATTTESYSPAHAPSGPRRIDVYTPTTDPNAPIGDAVLPLLLLLGVYCSIMVIRRNKHVKEVKS